MIDLTKVYNVSSLISLTRENVFIRTGASQSVTIIYDANFSKPAYFKTAITSLGKWTQFSETALKVTAIMSLDN